MRKPLFILLGTLLICQILSAQDSLQLDQVIVSATRIPTASYKTGRSISIITAEELRDLPVTTVDEMLRYLPGINLNSRNDFGVQSDIGIRGSTFSQVLILVDDVRVNDPLTAHFNNNIPVPLSEIAQVEIIRGPAAASYGSDAVGGIIHIKTRTFVSEKMDKSVSTRGNVGIGKHNLNRTDLGVNLQKNNWHFSTAYKANIADGETYVNPNFLAGNDPDSLYQNFFDLRTISAAVAGKIGEGWSVYGRVGYDYRDFNAKYFYTRSGFDESEETVKSLWTQGAIRYQKNQHEISLTGGYKTTNDLFVFNPLFSPNEHDTKQIFTNLQHRVHVNDRINLASGVQLIDKKINSTDRGDHQNLAMGIYSVLSYALSDRWQTHVSLRAEHDENFGWEILPQASLSYRQNGFVFRTSYGRSVRAADFTERYISSQIPSLSPGRNVGNPDLQAESSHSFDLGGEYYFNKNGLISLTGFYRNSTNLIDYSLRNSATINNVKNLQEDADYFYADNLSGSSVIGLEGLVKYRFNWNNRIGLNTQLAYTWLKTKAEAGELSKYIANHPTHQLGLTLDLTAYGFQITSATSLSTRQDELVESIDGSIPKDYLITHLKFGYNLSSSFRPYVEIRNLTNTNYQEILGANLPRRWWNIGVTWNW